MAPKATEEKLSYKYMCDAFNRSQRRIKTWHYNNLLTVLQAAKEKRVRDIDTSIAMAEELMAILDEKVPVPKVIPSHDVEPSEDDSLMKPISPSVLNLLYGSTEKGAGSRYLHARNKQSPEEKYFFRIQSSWDYGWGHKYSRVRPRDFNRGRCAILRDTFYRRNNLKPDPPHYAVPSGGEFSICSEYSCNFN